MTQRCAIHGQLNDIAVADNVDILLRIGGIRPVADDVNLRVGAEHRLADVVRLLGQSHAVDFAGCSRDFRGHAPAGGGIGEDPVGAAAMIGRAALFHPLLDLVHRELLAVQVVGHAPGFGISEIRRRLVVPHAARGFFAIIFAFDHRQTRNLATAFSSDANVHE